MSGQVDHYPMTMLDPQQATLSDPECGESEFECGKVKRVVLPSGDVDQREDGSFSRRPVNRTVFACLNLCKDVNPPELHLHLSVNKEFSRCAARVNVDAKWIKFIANDQALMSIILEDAQAKWEPPGFGYTVKVSDRLQTHLKYRYVGQEPLQRTGKINFLFEGKDLTSTYMQQMEPQCFLRMPFAFDVEAAAGQ